MTDDDVVLLIFDDMEISCIVLQKLLQKFFPEYDTQYVTTEEELLSTTSKPKVFFVDVMIDAKIQGFDVVEKLNKIHPNAKKVLYTGVDHQMLEDDMERMGINQIVKKPIIIDELKKLIIDLNI